MSDETDDESEGDSTPSRDDRTVEQIHDGCGAWPSQFSDELDDVDKDHNDLTRPPDENELDQIPFTDEEFWLDDRPGHGAQSMSEDWVRANHGPVSHDDRSVTRTTFYQSDADTVGPGQSHRDPEDIRTWSELASWNDGEQATERATQNFEADKRRWVETFGGQLGCTEYQIDRAQWILKRLDLSTFQGAHIPVENVILGILSLLIDADVPKTLPQELADDEVDGELDELDVEDVRAVGRPKMQELLADLEMDRRDLTDVRKKLRENAGHLLDPESDS